MGMIGTAAVPHRPWRSGGSSYPVSPRTRRVRPVVPRRRRSRCRACPAACATVDAAVHPLHGRAAARPAAGAGDRGEPRRRAAARDRPRRRLAPRPPGPGGAADRARGVRRQRPRPGASGPAAGPGLGSAPRSPSRRTSTPSPTSTPPRRPRCSTRASCCGPGWRTTCSTTPGPTLAADGADRAGLRRRRPALPRHADPAPVLEDRRLDHTPAEPGTPALAATGYVLDQSAQLDRLDLPEPGVPSTGPRRWRRT